MAPDRGRLFEGGGRGITWTSFDLPRTVTEAGQTTTFLYDAFGTRVKKTRVAPGQPTETTITIAGLYERRTKGATTDHRFFVYGDGEPVTEVVYHQQAATEDTHLLGRDGHGSMALVLDSDGTPLEHLYYEPFGGRTDVTGAPAAAPTTGVPWGFTGHQVDDDLGLINMGGRVYDPVLRRFLSPDPIVHDLLAGQTLNHYSYVWNNPLRYVDPSGFDGEVAGAPQPEASNSAVEEIAAETGSWIAEMFAPKQTLFKVKPPGQILPAGEVGRAPLSHLGLPATRGRPRMGGFSKPDPPPIPWHAMMVKEKRDEATRPQPHGSPPGLAGVFPSKGGTHRPAFAFDAPAMGGG